MDTSTFLRAKNAYAQKNWDTAVILFSQCGTGEGTGEACHLCGNALMRLGRVQEAVQAYRAAISDPTYANKGAVLTNLGKAQMALGDLRGSMASLNSALSDPAYNGAYKAHMALGDVYSKMGDSRNAGIQYRNAALDEHNPDPAKALVSLGVSFMQLKRPADAVEAYRTAYEYSHDEVEKATINSNLGQAYVSTGRMAEAVQAFECCLGAGGQLSPVARADYERAQQTLAMFGNRQANTAPGMDQGFGQGYGQGFGQGYGMGASFETGSHDPLPDASDSGFFSLREEDIVGQGKSPKNRDGESSHVGLKVFIVILLALLVLVGAGIFLFVTGFGVPSQESAIEGLFKAAAAGTDGADVWASDVIPAARNQAMAKIEGSGTHVIEGMDASISESVAIVSFAQTQGSTSVYQISLKREGLGWKVCNIERQMTSVDDSTYSSATGEAVGA